MQGSLFFPVPHEVLFAWGTSYYSSPCSSSFSHTPEVWSHGGTLRSTVCWILKGELPRFPEFFICLVLFSLQTLCLETQVALVVMVCQLGLLKAGVPQCSAWVSPLWLQLETQSQLYTELIARLSCLFPVSEIAVSCPMASNLQSIFSYIFPHLMVVFGRREKSVLAITSWPDVELNNLQVLLFLKTWASQ